jgi:pyruvate formate lyase activating enzyme
MEIPEKNIFSGILKFTTIDDYGYIGAILFTGGCNFRCPYCHNPDLVLPEKIKFLPKEEIINFLKSRVGLLESITICGGEPTIHSNLPEWIKYIKNLGFRVKLDTNATNKIMFKKILDENLIDFVAIDYKAPKNKYKNITMSNIDVNIIIENLKYLIKSNTDYEIRTTIHPDLHSKEDIFQMIKELKEIGIENYHLQVFKMPHESVGNIEDKKFKKDFFDDIKIELEKNFKKWSIRNLN